VLDSSLVRRFNGEYFSLLSHIIDNPHALIGLSEKNLKRDFLEGKNYEKMDRFTWVILLFNAGLINGIV
jgi:hypothetical protein